MGHKLLLALTTALVTACGSRGSEVTTQALGGDQELRPPALELTQRSSTQITLRWRDNNDAESGNTIERMTASSNTFTALVELGARQLGHHTYVDNTVSPDSFFCYRVKASNSAATKISPARCTWTASSKPEAVWRVQLRIGVADVEGAETDDSVSVRLNAPTSAEYPYGNFTAMNHGGDDFERNSTFTYDLDMIGISDMADINRIELYKRGEDGVCIRDFALLVNEVEVFSHSFSSSCHWLDYGGDHNSSFFVSHAELRAHSSWLAYTHQAAPLLISRADLESRIEALIGNAIAAGGLKWGRISKRPVEITKVTANVFHVDLDLEAASSEVDVDMEMQISFARSSITPGAWELELTTIGSRVNADLGWYRETVSTVINPLCTPITSLASDELRWNCASTIESYTEKRIENALEPIEKTFNAIKSCTPAAEVKDNGNLQFFCAS